MRSPAPKQAETEFDDLLGQLVDELAMTPASESAVQLVPDPILTEARVDSTHHLAAEAAAAAAAAAAVRPAPANNLVKIVGIIAASLSGVAIAAIMILGPDKEPTQNEPVVAADSVDDEARAAELAQAEQAKQQEIARVQAEQATLAAAAKLEADRVAAELAKQQAAATTPAETKPKVSSKPKPKKKPKPKPVPGDSFEDM